MIFLVISNQLRFSRVWRIRNQFNDLSDVQLRLIGWFVEIPILLSIQPSIHVIHHGNNFESFACRSIFYPWSFSVFLFQLIEHGLDWKDVQYQGQQNALPSLLRKCCLSQPISLVNVSDPISPTYTDVMGHGTFTNQFLLQIYGGHSLDPRAFRF